MSRSNPQIIDKNYKTEKTTEASLFRISKLELVIERIRKVLDVVPVEAILSFFPTNSESLCILVSHERRKQFQQQQPDEVVSEERCNVDWH